MSSADMLILIIAVVSVSLYSFLILSLYRGWIRLKKLELKDSFETFISVIIPIRNEAESLVRLTDLLKSQQYLKELHEFIFVNDHSTDATSDVLNSLKGVNVLHLPDGKQGKKAAISYGIDQAAGSLITTLDADCMPGPNWLASIVTAYEKENFKMIAGPVAIQKPKGILASFQALELLSLVASGGGAIGIAKPIMCNGANLTYEKKVFEEVNGFEGNEYIPGGDDIFMMEKVKRQYPKGSIGFIKDAEGLVYTPASSDVKAFIKQRFRWVSKSPSYKDPFLIYASIVVLGMNLMLLASFVWAFISLPGLWIFISLFLLKCLVDYPILRSATKLSRQQQLMRKYIPFQFIYFFFVSMSGILGNVLSFSWKGRQK